MRVETEEDQRGVRSAQVNDNLAQENPQELVRSTVSSRSNRSSFSKRHVRSPRDSPWIYDRSPCSTVETERKPKCSHRMYWRDNQYLGTSYSDSFRKGFAILTGRKMPFVLHDDGRNRRIRCKGPRLTVSLASSTGVCTRGVGKRLVRAFQRKADRQRAKRQGDG